MSPDHTTPPPVQRAILRHSIADRRAQVQPIATPADFKIEFDKVIDAPAWQDTAVVYCADFAAERLLYTVLDPVDVHEVFAAPFIYNAQLRLARGVVSVPFERLAEVAPDDVPRPIFVFSSGRAGSTLLARLIHGIGRRSASEPDVFTQLALLPPPRRAQLSGAIERLICRAAVASLANQCGPDVVIKLRSQGCRIAETVMAASPHGRAVMLLRERHDWALSRHRALREQPRQIAAVLAQAIVALDRLVTAGYAPLVLWYDELVADPTATLIKLLANSSLPSSAIGAGIAGVMASDSQAGSELAQTAVQNRATALDFAADFEREWTAVRPVALIERHGLERLL